MFKELDGDGSGTIDMTELILFVTKTRKQAAITKEKEQWTQQLVEVYKLMHKAALSIGGPGELFKKMDVNNDGKIELPELEDTVRQLFSLGSDVMPSESINALFAFFDADRDGFLSHA